QVDGVEQQFDRHQQEYRGAPGQHTVDTQPEEHGGGQVRDGGVHQVSGRLTTMAPTSAASSRTESTSNGSTQCWNSCAPRASAVPGAGRPTFCQRYPSTNSAPRPSAAPPPTSRPSHARRSSSADAPVGAHASTTTTIRRTTTADT